MNRPGQRASLQPLLDHLGAVLQVTESVVASGRGFLPGAGADRQQLRERLGQEGGAPAQTQATDRVVAILERVRDELRHTTLFSAPARRPARRGRPRADLV